MSFRLLPEHTNQSSSQTEGSYKLLPKEKPKKFEEARHVARSAARAIETVAGYVGDISETPARLAKYAIEKVSGKNYPEVEEAFNIAKAITSPSRLPTSDEIREQTKKIGEGYLEPKSEGEELSDQLVSDFSSLAIPVKGKIPFLRSLGIALGSNLAEKGAEALGAGEEGKTATKIGSAFLLSAFKPNGAKKYADNLYADAKKLVPDGATVPANNLIKESIALKKQLKTGGSASYKTPALTKVEELQKKIKNGRIPVNELTEFKIDINKARSGLYGDLTLDKSGRAIAKRNLDAAAKIVDNGLKEYGHANPAWEKAYRPANEVYGAIEQSKKVGNSIQRIIKQYPHSSGAILAAELFLAPKTIPIAVGGLGALKAGELVARIAKSKTLQKYYTEVVNAALKDDSALMIKYLNKLDAGLKKEEQVTSLPQDKQ